MDIKYYRAVTGLLEKGYLLNDISAALLMALAENKDTRIPAKKETKHRSAVPKAKPAVKRETEKGAKKQENGIKKTEKKKNTTAPKSNVQNQKRKKFKPLTRKTKNENSNT